MQNRKSQNSVKKTFLTAAAITPLLGFGGASFAQTSEGSAADSRQLDVILVQARKREESIQDVPVVVQAFDSELLEAFSTTQFGDLNDLVSGLTIYSDGPTQPSINLRGVQGNAINPQGDDSVAINVDGVQHSTSQLFRFGLFDLETIEVLKGPQALFFGKNSPGGIVAVRTKNPTDEFYAEFQGGYEFAGERIYGHAILSGPLSENWGARVGVRYADQEGYLNNIWGDGDPSATQPLNQHGPDFEELVIQGTLRGEFDRGSITLKAFNASREGGQYTQSQLILCNSLITTVNPFSDCTLDDNFSTEPFVIDPAFAPSFAPRVPTSDYGLTQISLDGNLELNDNWSLHSITGYVDIDNTLVGAVGGGPNSAAFSLGAAQNVTMETFSQELRLDGSFDKLKVMLGGFIDDRQSDQRAIIYISPTFPISPDALAVVDGNSWSIFAQAEYDVLDDLTVSFGGRYTDEGAYNPGRKHYKPGVGSNWASFP